MLAISVEIHAAIVGGLISGAVVLLGVVLAETLRRAWQRHEDLRRSTHVILVRFSAAMEFLKSDTPDQLGWRFGSPGWELYQEVLRACNEADIASRSRWTRRRSEVRAALDEISARMFAAGFRNGKYGLFVTDEEIASVPLVALSKAVFGEGATLDRDRYYKYSLEGLPVDPELKVEDEANESGG